MKSILFILSLLTSLSLTAEVIDNETELVGSFKDTASGLVWMDFRINNDDSYNDVVEGLKDDGKYYGWRFPTPAEVGELFYNLVSAEYAEATTDFSNGGEYGPMGYESTWLNPDSGWDSVFLAMGNNVIPPNVSSSFVAFYPHSEDQGFQYFGMVTLFDAAKFSTDTIFYDDRASTIAAGIPDNASYSMLLVWGGSITVDPEPVEIEDPTVEIEDPIIEIEDTTVESSKPEGGAFSFILILMAFFRIARSKK